MIQQVMTSEEQKHDSQLRKAKKSQSAAFLAVSRQQREQILKQTSTETPGPTRYNPNEALIRPKTTYNHRMRAPVTSPRPQKLAIASCASEGSLTCRYAQKAYSGGPLSKRSADQPTQKTLSLEEYRKAVSDGETELTPKSPALLPRALSFQKQTPRKWSTMQTVNDARFDLINYFPTNYTGSKRVYTANFKKATSRKEMFTGELTDGVYDAHPERCKARTDVCLLNYSKMSPRGGVSARYLPESPNFEKLEKGYQLALPRTHVARVDIGKMSPRPGTAGPGLTWMGYVSFEDVQRLNASRRPGKENSQ